VLARYLHGDAFDQTFARVDLRAANASERVLWYLTDHLNSVRLVLDESGDILDQIAYDAFGNIVAQLNPLLVNPILFTSREFDAETGLYYNRARHLDPTTGRWTIQDPLGFAAGDANLYRYVGNRATIATDPSGNIWYPGKYTIQYFREWRRGRELDAQLDEIQRRRHDPLAAVMQAGSGPWSIHNTYAIADPAFDRNWWQGMGDAAVLAAVGANWLAAGTTWVSPAGQQLVWQSGRWWNRTANRAATAEEAAAATQAVAAARGAGAPAARTVNHFDEIARFRQRAGLPAFRAEDSATGSVARAVVNDGTSRAYHGVNTGLSSNSIPSRMEVIQQLQTRGYFQNVTNIGQAPMLAHAEAHALMRAVERTGARSITIYSDRTVCRACRTQLHLLAEHLGVTELRVFEAGNPLPYIIMPRR
jgi:RHS repeat-associated protein